MPEYLALNPDCSGAFLHIAGLVNHQDRTWVTEGVDDVIAQILPHRIGVPAGTGQQVLQPVGSGITAILGNGPAILAVQAGNHAQHQCAGMA